MPNAVSSWSACGATLAALLILGASPAFAAPAPADIAAGAPQDALGQLASALSADMKDVKLDAPSADLDAGKSAKASLVLPRDLLAQIRAKAGELGLGKAAERVVVRVKLSGDGYAISPDLKLSAKLAPGRAARFHWKVRRTGAQTAMLSVHATGVLRGDGPSRSFVLAQLTLGAPKPPVPASAPPPTPVQATAQIAPTPPAHLSRAARRRARLLAMHEHHHLRSLKLPDFSAPDLSNLIPRKLLDMVRLGPVPPRELATGAGLLALAIVLWVVALGAAKRKARDERRRRFRTFEPSRFWDEPGRGF